MTKEHEQRTIQQNILSIGSLNRLREWFHFMEDVNPQYLDIHDYVLVKLIYEKLGWRIPESITKYIAEHKE